MTFARLRTQVDSLMRKYDTQLQLYRAAPLALELCDRMADAVTPGRPNPRLSCDDWAFNLFRKLRDRGIIPRSRIEVPFWPRRVWKPGMGYFAQTLTDAAGATRARRGYR